MGLKIKISTRIYPTEKEDVIRKAILSIFPDANIKREEDYLIGYSSSMENFGKILREMRIRDAARGVFLSNLKGNKLIFRINKQVATKGKISFSVGDVPLGDITVIVEGDDLEDLIDKIAPDTRAQRSGHS